MTKDFFIERIQIVLYYQNNPNIFNKINEKYICDLYYLISFQFAN